MIGKLCSIRRTMSRCHVSPVREGRAELGFDAMGLVSSPMILRLFVSNFQNSNLSFRSQIEVQLDFHHGDT
jgi:hypothetical protein